jgi:hypothetical protein
MWPGLVSGMGNGWGHRQREQASGEAHAPPFKRTSREVAPARIAARHDCGRDARGHRRRVLGE